jgi:hypothetical protein
MPDDGLLAACAVPDYMMKPAAERLRLLRKGAGLTGLLLLLKCFMAVISKLLLGGVSSW